MTWASSRGNGGGERAAVGVPQAPVAVQYAQEDSAMTALPDRSTFESAYAGQAPWDIGKPQKPFIDVADQITGSVLDARCGTGDTALSLAGRGFFVTGIHFLEVPIARARRKATERGLPATFLVKDALT